MSESFSKPKGRIDIFLMFALQFAYDDYKMILAR